MIGEFAKTERTENNGSPTVLKLSQLIRSDIRSRNLRPGDRYLTTEEVATQMDVAKGTANRAMQELARENVLTRNRKLGTFIGDAISPDPNSVDLICLFVRRSYYMSERHRLNEVINGVLSVLNHASVQISLSPDDHEMVFAERLVKANRSNQFKVGYLIASKSSPVQAYFSQAQLPALIMGTPFPREEKMPSVDLDQESLGRQIFQEVIKQKYRKVAVILRDRRGFGDDLMLNAITAEAMRSGLSAGDLIIRSVPSVPELAASSVRHLIAGDHRPEAIICRSRMLLKAVRNATRDMELKPADVPAIFSTDQLPDDELRGVCASVVPVVSAESQGRQIGEMLSSIVAGVALNPMHMTIGVKLKRHGI